MRRILLSAAVIATAAWTSGCASYYPRVAESFRSNPQMYQRVEIAPVSVALGAKLDSSLTRAQLDALKRPTGTNIVEALKEEIGFKGFMLSRPVVLLTDKEDYECLDEEARILLKQVHTDLNGAIKQIHQKSKEGANQPFQFHLGESWGPFVQKFGSKDAQAIVLFRAEVYFESSGKMAARMGMNVGLMLAAGVYRTSPAYITYHLALVDAKTGELLWYDGRIWGNSDGRQTGTARWTMQSFLSKMPAPSPQPRPIARSVFSN